MITFVWMLTLALALVGCTASPPNGEPLDTAADTGETGGGGETGDTSDLGPFPDGGEVYDLGDPSFTLQIEGTGAWTTGDGYWSGAVKTLRGSYTVDKTTGEAVVIEIDGDLAVPGRYAVHTIEFVRQLSQSGDVFHYSARNPEGFRLVVTGFADGDHLFAQTEGDATLTDSIGGGTATLGSLVTESWPPY